MGGVVSVARRGKRLGEGTDSSALDCSVIAFLATTNQAITIPIHGKEHSDDAIQSVAHQNVMATAPWTHAEAHHQMRPLFFAFFASFVDKNSLHARVA